MTDADISLDLTCDITDLFVQNCYGIFQLGYHIKFIYKNWVIFLTIHLLTQQAPTPPPLVLRMYVCSFVLRLRMMTILPATKSTLSLSKMCRLALFLQS